MTVEEWLEKRCVKTDIDYLKKCGFEIEIVKNEDTRFNSEYFVYVSDGKTTEIFRRPYDLERVVEIIKMYRGLNK
jgi:hypothetical protein